MKQYFVYYTNDFCNTYQLYYAETPAQIAALPKDVEHITRKQAEQLAQAERVRQKEQPMSSCFASSAIFPAGVANDYDFLNSSKYELCGYIWEKRAK